MTEDELEVICVTNFPNTGTRKTIWEGLRNVLDKLKEKACLESYGSMGVS